MLTRPSPLQLVFDNTAPGLRPVSVPQPQLFPVVESSKSRFFVQVGVFAVQVYRADWRNFVIAIAAVNAFRFIASAWTFFYDADIDLSTYHVSKLAQISLALGALYLLTAFIQIFGAISTALQRPRLIITYVYLAFLAALLISTAGFITGIEYFLLAEDIIGECVALAVEGSWVSKTIFRGKLRHGQIPSTKIAQEQCYTAWSYGSVSQVLGIFVFSVVPAIIFFLLAYTYYRQTTDPTHSACLNSKNSDVAYVHMEAYPNDNSPIFSGTQNPNGNGDGVDDAPLRARTSREQQKTNQNRAAVLLQQSVIMHSANDSPYGVSPGPPSYAPLRGTYGYGHVWFRGADGDVGGQRLSLSPVIARM